nr:hypothetical protein [Tanacetum cinerariifolium]
VEMRRSKAMGTYTDDEINRLARGGKQRGHIAVWVGYYRHGPQLVQFPRRHVAEENVPPWHLILEWKIRGTHLFARDCRWGRNPLRAFPSNVFPATGHRGKESPATSHRGMPQIVAEEST